MSNPTIGSPVLFVTEAGVTLPAVVVSVSEAGTVNVQVFKDESAPNVVHFAGVAQSTKPEPGKFHLALEAKEEKPKEEAPKAKKGEK